MESRKRILITGASKGIGRGIAECLRSETSYDLTLHYARDEKSVKEVANSLEAVGRSVRTLRFDQGNRTETAEILTSDIETNGAFYGVILNAGIANDAPFPAIENDAWDTVINTNLNGFYNVLKPCVMPMISARKPGRIIALSSISGIMGNRGQVNYSASKGGIIAAVKSLAVELAKRNITVNCVAPGIIDTGMITPEIWEHARSAVPMQRMGKPEEVGELVRFLLSENASYITRQVISINGGMA